MANSTLKIGKELHGDNILYRIESVLGQGSFGVTYKAKAFTVMRGKFGEELVETNTPKAIKEFFMKEVNERDESGSITGMSEGSLSYNYAQKFKNEAENLAGMSHPNIVKVIDFIAANNTYYYVMDYIEGEDLNEYLKHHKMSEQEATHVIMEVAKALKYMHEEKHMLHLDLKPGNIMRRKSDGHIFLIDFGLSKHYNEDGVPETSTSVGLGTPGYAPIEQANSKSAKQFRTTLDIYALGATYYKMLTGQTPPSADELVSDEDIVKEDLQKCGIDEKIVSIISNAMKPNVKLRTQSVDGFLKALNTDEVIEDEEIDEVTIICEGKNTTNAQTIIKAKGKTSATIKDIPQKKSKNNRRYQKFIYFTAFLIILGYTGRISNYFKHKNTEQTLSQIADSISEDNTINGHEFIDLGLSVKWATCNVGADSPSDYGDYFAWGETLTKSMYIEKNSVNYKQIIGDISGISKYDVARTKWGGTWRLPTSAEIDELKNKCKRKWTIRNGHNGLLIIGPNGNSIFFPATGWRYNSSLLYVGEYGHYWSSTPYEDDTMNAYGLNFGCDGLDKGRLYRYFGCPVRPVSE